jgi:hypothetical protein
LLFVVLSVATLIQSDTNATMLAIALGFVIGAVGHLVRSRTLILIGILMIAIVSAYFTFGLAKVDLATVLLTR